MLVLTRQPGEKLVIGNEILVEVISISRDGVRLGITAPRETSVHRFEIYADIQSANQTATAPTEAAPREIIEDLATALRQK
jgi:carbon storage regulator